MSSNRRLRQKNHGVGLPHDLIVDIFGKLPAKSLVRFKYLSEQWFRLFTDPHFIDLHLSNQRRKFPRFVTASIASGDRMLNSCDGLLCVHDTCRIIVLNPDTKEYRCLFMRARGGHVHDRLAIGRDSVTKRYKIVRVFDPDVSKTGQVGHHDFCEVFILDPNRHYGWKTIGEVPYRIDRWSRSMHVDGAIYWFTDEINHLNKTEVIIMFDLHIEQFQAIPHPSSCSNKQRRTMQLGTLRECLCLAQLEVDLQVLNVWIMEKQQQNITWEKLYCIQLPRNDLHVGLGFTFAEHKDGTLVVCSMDHVFLYKQNNGILVCCESHGYGPGCVPLPTAFTGSIVPLYGVTLRQFSDLPITFTEIPIFTVKP
ncbi:hypothetical protein V6N13_090701 [Hibiscus sabdariffa]|uniref:F-box domain-containing protein n=2 Tax=Hibiscus sabdariffa TaxID=183260 RepID=A0ABR2BNM0_9ROSI